MSLWARRVGLVLLPALLLLGCERDDLTIGLPPKDNVFELGYFEYPLILRNNQEDSVSNQGTGRLLMGNFDDPNLGMVETIGYSTIDPVSFNPPPAFIGATADSLVLYLRLDYIYGGTDVFIDMEVRELGFRLNNDVTYKSSDEQPDQLMSSLGTIVQQFPMSTFLNDSLVVVSTQLDLDRANVLLDSLEESDANFEFEDSFKELFGGLAFIPGPSNDGIVGIDVDNSETRMILYYTDTDGSKESWSMKFNVQEHYNYISPNGEDFSRPGTDLETLSNAHTDFDTPGNYIYYHGGTGLGITTEADVFFDMADTLQNTLISTAALEIENIETIGNSVPPQILRVLLTDDTNAPKYYNGTILRTLYQGSRSDTLDLSSLSFIRSASEELLKYDKDRNVYTADITLYIQAFLEGRVDLTKLWIYDPRVATNISSWRTLKDNIKIKIYYTKSKI